MLRNWFGLLDPQLEEQLRDRISFRRFVGLGTERADAGGEVAGRVPAAAA